MSREDQFSAAINDLTIDENELTRYQVLLSRSNDATGINNGSNEEIRLAPLIWWDAKNHLDNTSQALQQYAILGHAPSSPRTTGEPVEPILLNTNAPWSAFLCGSQGSGKSHALSCMLENCLLNSPQLGKSPNPLAGLVLHYDGSRGSGVCEAAYLCTEVPTTLLVPASNYGNLKQRYEDMAAKQGGSIKVEKLMIAPKHLDTERVKTLMAVSSEGEAPLYIQTLVKIIRDIAIESGGTGAFDYLRFKKILKAQMFSQGQNQPLQLRIDLLESFLDVPKTPPQGQSTGGNQNSPVVKLDESAKVTQDYLVGKPGELLIVDLTDPVVDVDAACVIFDTCLSIFLAQTPGGKIVALDEAHNYLLRKNAAAEQFTGRLLKTIREQRHQGTRIVIATQEPTLDTALLDLCSITMVHRCTSPAWYDVLKKHIAGLYLGTGEEDGSQEGETEKTKDHRALFQKIVELKVGESLLFCPTAVMGIRDTEVRRMLGQFLKFRTRDRITADGGRTRLAGDA